MTRVGPWLGTGWQVVTANLWPLVLLGFVWTVVVGVAEKIHPTLSLIVLGPATAAGYAVALSAVRTGRADFSALNEMGPVWLQAMVAGIVMIVFTAIGAFFLIIPGLIIAALYLFALLLIVDRRMNFWDAMEESRKMVWRDVVGFLGFLLAIIGVNLLGLTFLVVGFWVSFPVTLCAVGAAYEELWPGEADRGETAEPTS